jgi:hypothetical protein
MHGFESLSDWIAFFCTGARLSSFACARQAGVNACRMLHRDPDT